MRHAGRPAPKLKMLDRSIDKAARAQIAEGESSALQGSRFATFDVLGVPVAAVQIPDVIRQVGCWIQACDAGHFITVTGMHGVMEAHHDAEFRQVLDAADLNVPDGMPLVWLARLRGHRLARRVYGPELMSAVCDDGVARGYRHFLYGGGPTIAEKLADVLCARFPGISIVGTYSPSFGPVSPDEDRAQIEIINKSQADVVWVGLSTSKQERWMFEHRDQLGASVLVGVGAAFDFHTGTKQQAPQWMREHGLEWLFRLLQEPRRLWRRYFIYGGQFAWLAGVEEFRRRLRK